ncbi:MAG: iron-containing alcohol dehydrogenase [Spirochaetaceae bacterium]|nr:iron-containing alcohol dehydrogenase [Spirochaetaceae bacterium]
MKTGQKSFNFILPTEIEYGSGAAGKLPQELVSRGVGSVLLITDKVILSQAFTTGIVESIAAEDIRVAVYDGVEANPKDRNVEEAATQARNLRADAIVAIGGGSPIDCAKAVSVVAGNEGSVRSFSDSSRIFGEVLPLYTIPTTAGTGSEVTFSSVITDTRDKFKFTIKSPKIAPRVAYIDPLLTHSMPAALTAATGLDALTHAIEAITAKVANPLSDAAALHAIELINAHLVTAVVDPSNAEARDGMMTGSLLAGIAFSHSDVAGVHCIAEALGGKYDAPHGVCNALVLPVMMEYNIDFALERYARIAKAMGLKFEEPADGASLAVRRVEQLAEELGLPEFRSLGVQTEDLQELAENSARNGSNKDNPRPMGTDDYLKVLQRLMG